MFSIIRSLTRLLDAVIFEPAVALVEAFDRYQRAKRDMLIRDAAHDRAVAQAAYEADRRTW